MTKRFLRSCAISCLFWMGACGEDGPAGDPDLLKALAEGQDLVPVYRADGRGFELDGAGVSSKPPSMKMTPAAPTFYLAFRKDKLAAQWFLSAYMKQFAQGTLSPAGSGLAAQSLGTRAVTFRTANGKVYVLDTGTGKQWSDVFDPEVIVEAFPIVTGFAAFDKLRNADKYVLFDPSSGLNRFGLETDRALLTATSQYTIDLAYVQSFRRLQDGATFEKVFTGYILRGSTSSQRTSGTLGIALRRYAESPGFLPAGPPMVSHYFTTLPRLVANRGRTERLVTKWNIKMGMTPIRWHVTTAVDRTTMDERFRELDLFGAIKRGIESWNEVFGFTVFTAERAARDVSFADDDRNVFVWDPNPTGSAAFANFRINPNTGEVRGASVYMPSVFLESAYRTFMDMETTTPMGAAPGAEETTLTWGGMHAQRLCDLAADGPTGLQVPTGEGLKTIAALSLKEKLERRITSTAAHEVGHTLGLRHNFKGSLKPPSSSIMEYSDTVHRVASPLPGEYDQQAVAYLYGSTDKLPELPFCTDGDTALDPLCATYDATATPLASHHGVRFTVGADRYFVEAEPRERASALGIALDGLFGLDRFLRSAATATEAWKLIAGPIRAPIPPEKIASAPAYAARVDTLTRTVLTTLFPEPPAPGSLVVVPAPRPIPPDPALNKDLAGEIKNILLDLDRIRTMEARRLTIDALRRMQHLEGLKALREARELLATARMTATGDARLLLDDLIARIDRATTPYFDR